jgi:hypothetical protein
MSSTGLVRRSFPACLSEVVRPALISSVAVPPRGMSNLTHTTNFGQCPADAMLPLAAVAT